MKKQIREIGNSEGTIIPAVLLRKFALSKGDPIEITETDEGILIRPVHNTPHYTLAELLNECDISAPVDQELRAWDDMTPVGREVL